MSYYGAAANIDFMRSGNTIYARVFNRWVSFCHIYEWTETFPGRLLGYLKKIRREG